MSHASQIATIQPFTIYQIDHDAGNLVPYLIMDQATLVALLQISEHNLREQVDNAPLHIGWYSRLDAQAERCQEYLERKYAVWKANKRIEYLGSDHPVTGKKTTIAQAEDLYRTHADYGNICRWLEEARESKRSIAGVVSALRAKAKRLDVDIFRTNDGRLQRRTA